MRQSNGLQYPLIIYDFFYVASDFLILRTHLVGILTLNQRVTLTQPHLARVRYAIFNFLFYTLLSY